MESVLRRVRNGTKAPQRKEIVAKLNSLALKIPLKDKIGDPILDGSGNPMAGPILGIASFQLEGGSIEIGAEPVVNGMEFACWYALLLISRQPGKIRRCTLESCGKWFNKVTTDRGFSYAYTQPPSRRDQFTKTGIERSASR